MQSTGGLRILYLTPLTRLLTTHVATSQAYYREGYRRPLGLSPHVAGGFCISHQYFIPREASTWPRCLGHTVGPGDVPAECCFPPA